MTPERLNEIETQLRRHPSSPHNIELALEAVAELRARMEVDRVKAETVGQAVEPIAQSRETQKEASSDAAPPRRKR